MGGKQPGVEMWNPVTGMVSLIMDVHPAETITDGLYGAAILSIKGIFLLPKC